MTRWSRNRVSVAGRCTRPLSCSEYLHWLWGSTSLIFNSGVFAREGGSRGFKLPLSSTRCHAKNGWNCTLTASYSAGVLRGNFTWYVADLVCLREAHRRTTSFPQDYQEPNNSPYQNQIRNQGWIEKEGVVGAWEGREGKAGWPTTTIPLGLLRDSDPHFRVPVVATSPSTSFKQLKPLKAYRLIGECWRELQAMFPTVADYFPSTAEPL